MCVLLCAYLCTRMIPRGLIVDDARPTSVNELISQRRKDLVPSLSMRQAAHRAGRSPSWWRQYETGERRLAPAPAAEMALVVGLTPDELEAEGYPAEAGALRNLLRERLAAEPGLESVGQVAIAESEKGSDALLVDIVRGLDEIRNEPRLTPDQKRELEATFRRGLRREVSAQLENVRLMIRIAQSN